MREGCEVHTGDLRVLDEARKATRGCSHVIHLAAIVGGIANFHKLPHTLTEVNNALYNAVFRAALDEDVERFVYVSSSHGLRARDASTRRARTHLRDCPIPHSAYGFSKLTGEVYCRAAHDEHGLPVHDLPPVQRLRAGRDARRRAGHRARGPRPDPQVAAAASGRCRSSATGEQTRTLTHVDDIADGIVTAMASPAGLNEDFNISASRRADRRRDRAHQLGGVRATTRPSSSSSTCRASRSTSCAAGRRSRRPSGCWAGRRGSACEEGIAPDRRVAARRLPQTA